MRNRNTIIYGLLFSFTAVAASSIAIAAEAKAAEATAPQHCATITLTQGVKAGPKATIAAPRITFVEGQKAQIEIGDAAQKIEIEISPTADKRPGEHLIRMKLTANPGQKNANLLAAPQILMGNNSTASVTTTDGNGDELTMQVTIASVPAGSP